MLAGNAELMKYVRKVSSPYNVNGVALECLPVALADEEYLDWYAEQVHVGRERMMAGLTTLGVPFFPSHANFVLMKIGPKHEELVKAMREARRAAAGSLDRSGMRWVCAHHDWRGGACHARDWRR